MGVSSRCSFEELSPNSVYENFNGECRIVSLMEVCEYVWYECQGMDYLTSYREGCYHGFRVMDDKVVRCRKNAMQIFPVEDVQYKYSLKKEKGTASIKGIVPLLDNGDSFDDFYQKFAEFVNRPTFNNILSESRPYYGDRPKFTFNGNKTWFSLIECEMHLLSIYANRDFVQEHIREFCKDAIEDLEKNRSFKKFGIPIHCLKCTRYALKRDGTLVLTFQLKAEYYDDIERR